MNRLHSECMKCLMKHLKDLPDGASEAEKIDYMQQGFRILADAPLTSSAPVILWEFNKLKKHMFGIENQFAEIKRHFNALMLSYEDSVRETIRRADDPLKAAIRYAMIGNYIDFGAMDSVSEEHLAELLRTAQNMELTAGQYELLQKDLEQAERLLLLTDNCGEIVMDKILVETLQEIYPNLHITVMVRGEPVQNDATLDDAQQVGMTEIAEVIGNGNGVAGTCMEVLSPEAKAAFDDAQVILAKGQGNFETLCKCGRNIYYIFLCKCDMFAEKFQVPKFTGMLIHDSSLKI